jgi:hypothetical protein
VNYKFLKIFNLKIKSQRLHEGNVKNYENSENRTFSRDDIKTITQENPSSGKEDTAE